MRRLRHKVNVAMTAAFLLVAIIYACVHVPFQHKRNETLAAKIHLLLETLVDRDREALANEIFEGRVRAIQLRIEQMGRIEGVESICVYADDGSLLRCDDEAADDGPLADRLLAELKSADHFDEMVEFKGHPSVMFVKNITAADEQLGFIRLHYSLQDAEREWQVALVLPIVLLVSLLAILFLLMDRVISRSVVRPIGALRDALHGLQTGVMGAQIPVESQDEIGEVSRAFNIMSRERAASDEALRQSEERFRVLVEQAADALFVHDMDGCIVDVNHQACESLGSTRDELLGMKVADVDVGADVYALRDETWVSLDTEPSALLAGTHRRKDGSQFPVEVRLGAIHTGNEKLVLALARDITERKKAEAERQILEEQLRQSQKMEAIGQLAGGIAHDFNNLLQVIQGYSHEAMDRLELNSQEYRDLEEVAKAVDSAATLVRQLLAFSRQDALRPEHINLADVIANMTKMLRRVIGENIELTVTHEPGPKGVFADPGQIEQVLMNLCVNARDAMPEGGRITIRTAMTDLPSEIAERRRATSGSKAVMLSIADTGGGIPDSVLGHIFEPFFTTKDVGKGTGMGLATVYGIVRQHGGHADAISKVGGGSTFRVFLPLQEAPIVAETEAEARRAVERGHETILLGEDEELVRNLAVQILEQAGYEVIIARDGAEAIELYEKHADSIALALLDVIMPKQSGRAVFDRMMELGSAAPVLFSTGYSFSELKGTSLPPDGYELIQKPYTPVDLLRKVRTILDASAQGNT